MRLSRQRTSNPPLLRKYRADDVYAQSVLPTADDALSDAKSDANANDATNEYHATAS